MMMTNQSSTPQFKQLFHGLTGETAAQIQGGRWAHSSRATACCDSTYPCTGALPIPGYDYGYGQAPAMNQTVNVNVGYED